MLLDVHTPPDKWLAVAPNVWPKHAVPPATKKDKFFCGWRD
jgi:hypothetical protein